MEKELPKIDLPEEWLVGTGISKELLGLYRNNPELIKEGKNPFILDSKEPQGDFREFLRGEVRFSSLERTFPEAADALFERTESEAKARYARYKELAEKN